MPTYIPKLKKSIDTKYFRNVYYYNQNFKYEDEN